VPLASITINLNLDMLAEGGRRNRLYVTPSKALPELIQLVASAINSAGLCLVKGHRSSRGNFASRGHINWRHASDHAAFASKHIPYLFLGVSNHSRYHSENDISNNIDQKFFTGATETALSLLLKLDEMPPQ
jgi:Zn-dependent M28 family amino/carboxypeptidase